MSISENVAFDELINSKHNANQRETFAAEEPGKSRIVDCNQPSQNTMNNQTSPNPYCWEALQNLRTLNAGAPFVDCLFDLREKLTRHENALFDLCKQREQITEKDQNTQSVDHAASCAETVCDYICGLDDLIGVNPVRVSSSEIIGCLAGDDQHWWSANAGVFTGKIERVMRHLREINNELKGMPVEIPKKQEHTIVIDGVTYYNAKHYQPADGEAVIGFEKGNDLITYRSDPSIVRRPYPFVVWYNQRQLCWYIWDYTRKVTCKINIIAWTHLPHPKSAEEFQDFCNSL
jgi:hypothetical protein